MAGKLTIVSTPIGNLGDMPPRALDALREADVVLAEDTRVTGKLLAALGVEGKRLERLDENLMGSRADAVVQRVRDGEAIAYCTDAGMPGVSDPGLRLVAAARACDDVVVEVIPGPTAVATAYVASGTTAQAFYFGGFFPRKEKQRSDVLRGLAALDAALIFYESPNRIMQALEAIAREFPAREVAVCRELTKLHEEVTRGNSGQVLEDYRARDSVKGEIVIVIDPPAQGEGVADEGDVKARAAELAEQDMRAKDIAKALAKEFGIPRNKAYAIALEQLT